MADDVKIERHLDDKGRRIEVHIYETIVDGKKERVTETYIEQVPMEMSERVVEEISPVITTRKKEVYKSGKKVDAVVESIPSNVMEVQQPQRQNDVLTKADLVNVLQELFAQMNTRQIGSSDVKMLPEPSVPETPKVEEPVKDKPNANNSLWEHVETGAYMVLSAELAFCVYHLILRNWI